MIMNLADLARHRRLVALTSLQPKAENVVSLARGRATLRGSQAAAVFSSIRTDQPQVRAA